MKRQIIKSFKYITIGIFFAVAVSYVQAWSNPLMNTFKDNTSQPTTNNVSDSLNVGSSDQTKQGGLSLGGWFSAVQNAQIVGQTFINGMLRAGAPGDKTSEILFGGSNSTVNVEVSGGVSTSGTMTSKKLAIKDGSNLCADSEGNIVTCAISASSTSNCLAGTRKDNVGNCGIPEIKEEINTTDCNQWWTRDNGPLSCLSWSDQGMEQSFVVGESVAAGDVFYVAIYSYILAIGANADDNRLTITTKLSNQINSTSVSSWNVDNTNKLSNNTPNFPPTSKLTYFAPYSNVSSTIPRFTTKSDNRHKFSAGVWPAN
jgi:hypothetical protein